MKTIGKYTVLGEIGKGGTGVVYRAVDPMLEREVAIKQQTVDTNNEESVQRFLREARLVASLVHRNIVLVFDMGQESDSVFIVMELLRGRDLSDLVRSRARLSLEEKLRIVREVGLGLAHAHGKGVVHRDVKPRNVFVTESREVKLLDFGLARVAQSTLTATGQLLGTPHYMSPEQVLGRRADPRSDIFSLGALFYELLTGEKPFGASTLRGIFERIQRDEPESIASLAPAVGSELTRIVSKMMCKSLDERYGSMDAVLSDLIRFRRELEGRKQELRREVSAKARQLAERVEELADPTQGPSRAHVESLLDMAEREKNLGFEALMGLRDGIDVELWRVGKKLAGGELLARGCDDGRGANAALENARSRFAAGDLAGCLVGVSEALRLCPDHVAAGELAEELRRAVVERAACLDREDVDSAQLGVLVAALLACEGDDDAITAGSGEPADANLIATLNELLE